MGNTLAGLMDQIEQSLKLRTGIDCLSERPDRQTLNAFQIHEDVTTEGIVQGLKQALEALRLKRRVAIRCQLPGVTAEIGVDKIVSLFLRMVSTDYQPELPRLSEWQSDDALKEGLLLVYREFLKGILTLHLSLNPAPTIRGTSTQIEQLQGCITYAAHMTSHEVVTMVADALRRTPPDRRVVLMTYLAQALAMTNIPSKISDYEPVISACERLTQSQVVSGRHVTN